MAAQITIWNEIENQTGLYRKGAAAVLNIADFNRMAITSHSTRIEGSTLTLNETISLLEKGIPATGKPIDHQNMVIDHHEALFFILNNAKEKRPLSIGFIQEIAALAMRRTGKTISSILGDTEESRGDFRKVSVSAGGHFFGGYQKVEPMMNELIARLNKTLSTVKSLEEIHTLAFAAHFDLVSIHPFTDGNGRASRLLMNYIQAYHDQPLTIVQDQDKADYIEALQTCRIEKTTAPIINFLAQQHLKWMARLEDDYQNSLMPEAKKGRGKGLGYSIFY